MENLKPRVDDSYAGVSYRISRFPGICKWCGERYGAGAKVNWNPRVKGTCCHAGCYSKYGSPSGFVPQPYNPPAENDPNEYVPVLPEEQHTPKAINVGEMNNHPPIGGNSSLGQTLADAIAPYLDSRLKGVVTEEQVKAIVEKLFDGMVFKHVTCVEYTNEEKVTYDCGLQHKQFPKLLKALTARTSDGFRPNIWLAGPAGTGKTTAAKKCAEVLGLDFYFIGSIDTEYKLLGFVDAQGRVTNTQFREAYEKGGVFLFDECDSSLPPALLAFNAALANGECAFPGGIVKRHPDFICIAAANTWGLGATNDYVGRLKLDAAFLDRFISLPWDIDEELETVICGNPEWAKKVQQWRANAKTKGIKVVISPRASIYGASLLAVGMEEEQVIEMVVRKGMSQEQWNSVSRRF